MKPERVFYYFRQISDIPRESDNEKAVSDYLLKTGKELGLIASQDEFLNVYLKKEASEGCQNAPGIIMQGHMDMVCEKSSSSNHDFTKDPIEWIIEDDLMYANNTTLGADNAIGVAMALAILEDKEILHPQLEAIFTTAEETEMDGALNLASDLLKGDYLLNLDSEEEGILTLGSAGGELFTAQLTPEYEAEEKELIKLNFDGFFGGHSGAEIHKNRENMLKTMADFLKTTGLNLAHIEGGTKDNAIPRTGEIVVENTENLDKLIENFLNQFKSDENLEIHKIEEIKGKLLTTDTRAKLLELLLTLPTGVHSRDSIGIISSYNLATLKAKNGVYEVEDSIRSSSNPVLEDIKKEFANIAKNLNLEYKFSGGYPSWEKKENSSLEKLSNKVYKEITGKEFENIVIHAGLECGAIYEKYPNLEIVSFGPDIRDAHTPKENLSISSTERVYDFTKKLIEEIAKN